MLYNQAGLNIDILEIIKYANLHLLSQYISFLDDGRKHEAINREVVIKMPLFKIINNKEVVLTANNPVLQKFLHKNISAINTL